MLLQRQYDGEVTADLDGEDLPRLDDYLPHRLGESVQPRARSASRQLSQ
jgi:hypothetical protein